jgi:hypothetical protein
VKTLLFNPKYGVSKAKIPMTGDFVSWASSRRAASAAKDQIQSQSSLVSVFLLLLDIPESEPMEED